MSLFSSSTLGLPIKLEREWRSLTHQADETGRRSTYLQSPGDGSAGEFHVKMLLWELDSQMKRYEDIKRHKVHRQAYHGDRPPLAGTSVSYEWLRRDAPKRPEVEMAKSARREIQGLCERMRPCDLNQISAAFAEALEAKEPPPEDVPRIFVYVLRSFLICEEGKPKRSNFERLMARISLVGSLRRFIRPNRVEPEMGNRNEASQSSVQDVEGRTHRREGLFSARTSRLHCLLDLENEPQPMTNFAMSLSERATTANRRDATESSDLEMQRYGRQAWQKSVESVTYDRGRPAYGPTTEGESKMAAQAIAGEDMEVIDLVSASSSEDATASGPSTSIRV